MGIPRCVAVPIVLAIGSAWLASAQPPQRLVRLTVAATNGHGEAVTDLQPSDLQIREDGRPRPLVFFRFAERRRSIQPLGPGEFVNRPLSAPIVILVDRWNEGIDTAAGTWIRLGAVLQRMDSVNGIYLYFLTGNGDLFPVHPLPVTEADLRATPNPSAAELSAEFDQAIRSLQKLR